MNNYYVNSFLWSTAAKLINALLNFISLPILLRQFGIDNYGVLTLAIATNAYMSLLDLGINTGSIKHFAQWREKKRFDLIKRVAGTSISFYGIIGILNALLLLTIAFWGSSWFQLTQDQFAQYRISLFILAGFAVINWGSSVFVQLLTAAEKISYIQRLNILKTLTVFILIWITVWFDLTINEYFFFFILINSILFIPYYILSRKIGMIDRWQPLFYWKDFGHVLKYSLAIFIMAIFQATATQSRPIVLGFVAENAATTLAEYRIIEVFPLFIISICGAMIGILLPKSAQHIARGDQAAIERFAYTGTRYTSILTTLICIPIMLCAYELITVYVGLDFGYLSKWLVLWTFTLLLNLYNSPISSLILATGRTRMLVYSSAIACIISIIVNVVLCRFYGVGSAVIGYFVYILIQQGFYYCYFNTRIMKLNSWTVLRMFIVPTGIGLALFLCISWLDIDLGSTNRFYLILQGFLKGAIWLFLFLTVICSFKILRLSDLKNWLVLKSH